MPIEKRGIKTITRFCVENNITNLKINQLEITKMKEEEREALEKACEVFLMFLLNAQENEKTHAFIVGINK